jgi:hypothetical protein
MDNWYKKHQGIIWLLTITVSLVAYAYTTFATVSYVDLKHENVMDVLREIRTDVREIRSYEKNR